jgi:sugar phosphate isomerase/epimerase
LEDALRLLADLGYRGVFLTLDVHHLDPFAPDLPGRVAQVSRWLSELDLAVVVETGARFLLDPRRKHWPVLLSREGAERREAFLMTALRVGRDLDARCVSLWTGGNPQGLEEREVLGRLTESIGRLLREADTCGVDLALEPEPGMWVEDVAGFHRLREACGRPTRLRLSLDCGHLLVTGEGEPADVIRREREHLSCVAIEDMKRGVHEHLPFGEGDLDLPPLLLALAEVGFDGVVAVELGRHGHEGPYQAERSRDVLRSFGVPFGEDASRGTGEDPAGRS